MYQTTVKTEHRATAGNEETNWVDRQAFNQDSRNRKPSWVYVNRWLPNNEHKTETRQGMEKQGN